MNSPDGNARAGGRPGAKSGQARKGGGRNARRRAREFAVQGVYQWLLSQADSGTIEAFLAASPGFGLCDKPHFDALLHGAIRLHADLEAAIVPHLDRPVAQVSPVERAILLVGTYEMLQHQEIPYRVVINEAIDIAKEFGGTDGFKFVNGILDKVAAGAGALEGRR